jgi:hypothetical protein
VQEFPIKSKLDPSTYGDPVSAITAKIVNSQLPDGWDVEKVAKFLYIPLCEIITNIVTENTYMSSSSSSSSS